LITERLRAAGCVFAEDEADLLLAAADTTEELDRLVARRVSGVPLEHVLGWAEFCGLRIAVTDGVFVPRQRSRLLVAEVVRASRPGALLVELCCGSGAIAAAVRAAVPELRCYAVEVDAVAAECARRNLPDAQVLVGDLYAPLPDELRGRVDVVVANAPYVPSDAIATMPHEARDHEPRAALDGGPDGLSVLRRVIADAPEWLTSQGVVLVECSAAQATEVSAAMARAGLPSRLAREAELDATAVIGWAGGEVG
jgi:release factor glutamine methyltransferase